MTRTDGMVLMAMDLQNDFCHPDGVYGRGGKGFSHVPNGASEIMPRVIDVLRACNEAEVPIVATRLLVLADKKGRAIGLEHFRGDLQELFAAEGFRRGTWGQDLVAEVREAVEPDFEVNKWGHSAMYLTELEKVLRALGARHLVFVGLATNGVVEGTARDAVSRGWKVTTLTDCVAAPNPSLHEASLRNLGHIGSLHTAGELIAALSKEPAA
ncbi:MAG: cysteine hydrolase family protein [Acidimicrobiales bacterium]